MVHHSQVQWLDPQGVTPPPKEHVVLLKIRLGEILLGQDSLSDRMVGILSKSWEIETMEVEVRFLKI